MGGSLVKETADAATGLTAKDRRHIRDIWHTFTTEHQDYGEILFTAFFVKHPDYQQLFPKFRGKQISSLKGDPKFRAHASTVGHHITTMVDYLDSPEMLIGILENNAKFHAETVSGVRPEHFVELGQVIVEVLCANYDDHMTAAVLTAWEKLFKLMNEKNVAVYAAETADALNADGANLQSLSTTDIFAEGNESPTRIDSQRRYSQGPLKTGDESKRAFKSPEVDVPAGSSSEEQPPVDGEVPKHKGQHRKSAASQRAAPKPAEVTDVVSPSGAANATALRPSTTVSPTEKERRKSAASGKAAPKPAAVTDVVSPSGAAHGAALGPSTTVSPTDKEKSAASGKSHLLAHKAGHGAVAEGAEHKLPHEQTTKGKEATHKSKVSHKSSHHKKDKQPEDKPPPPTSSERS